MVLGTLLVALNDPVPTRDSDPEILSMEPLPMVNDAALFIVRSNRLAVPEKDEAPLIITSPDVELNVPDTETSPDTEKLFAVVIEPVTVKFANCSDPEPVIVLLVPDMVIVPLEALREPSIVKSPATSKRLEVDIVPPVSIFKSLSTIPEPEIDFPEPSIFILPVPDGECRNVPPPTVVKLPLIDSDEFLLSVVLLPLITTSPMTN